MSIVDDTAEIKLRLLRLQQKFGYKTEVCTKEKHCEIENLRSLFVER